MDKLIIHMWVCWGGRARETKYFFNCNYLGTNPDEIVFKYSLIQQYKNI